MATEPTSVAQAAPGPVAKGYEPRDASVPWIFGIVVGLACCGLVIHIVLSGFSSHLLRSPAPSDAWRPIRQSQAARQPPPPRLQISPRLQLKQFRAQEDQELTTYGWINPTAGIVRIPIERAMDIVLQKGLPTRTNSSSELGPSSAQLIEQRVQERQPVRQEGP
jgi:hypothetical protein